MYLDASDQRPRSLFDRTAIDRDVVIAGVATAAIVHLVVPLVVLVIVGFFALVGVELGRIEPPPPELPPVIQARFLQLGEHIDPRELPNRRVPILRTDTPEPRPSKRSPTDPPPERAERQPDAVADALQRLSNDAQIFAEAEERRILEGDPDGIEGGEREASEGDLYAGRLSVFFRRGWSVPTTIPRDDVQELSCTVNVDIGEDLRIAAFRIVGAGSGNPDFDLSVTAQLQRLVDSQSTIPPPPEEVAAEYIGRTRPFRFRGRDAR
jgi:hypothetical protein